MSITRSSFLVIAISTSLIAACAPDIEQRGNLPTHDELAAIHPGTTTKDQVVKILGTPSSVGIFDNQSWYYISNRTKQVAFFLPDTLDQQVYVVNFNSKGVVEAVEHRGLKDAREITPAPGATPAPGRELTFLEQIIGNLGRFNGSSGGGGGGESSGGGAPRGPNPQSEE